MNGDSGSSHSPLLDPLNLKAVAVGGVVVSFVFCSLLEGGLSHRLYLSDICGLPPPTPRVRVVNGERPACWYAEVGERKSRSGFSEMRALCHE